MAAHSFTIILEFDDDAIKSLEERRGMKGDVSPENVAQECGLAIEQQMEGTVTAKFDDGRRCTW